MLLGVRLIQMASRILLALLYQLSDIYDAVIAKTTTSGDRKIGGLLQSTNQRPRKTSEL